MENYLLEKYIKNRGKIFWFCKIAFLVGLISSRYFRIFPKGNALFFPFPGKLKLKASFLESFELKSYEVRDLGCS